MILILSVNTIAIFFAYFAKYRNWRFMFIISQLLLTLVYGIRYDFGNDYWNYYDVFIKCSDNYDPDVVEPAWWFINHIFQPIGFFGMVFCLTAFENFTVYHHIKKFVPKEYWWLSILIFTMTFNFMLLGQSMMRQYLAMLVLLYSIKYIAEKNIIKFLIILILAVSIHKTSIIFSPIYLFAYLNPKLKSWKCIVFSVVSFIVLMAVSIKYLDIFQMAAVIFEDEKFNRYLLGDEGSYSFTIIFDILWMVLLMYFYPDNRTKSIICIVSVISYIFLPFSFIVVMLVRLMLFFSVFFIFSIPNMFSQIRVKPIRYNIILIYMVLLLRRSLVSMTGETYGRFYDTYQTIFSAPSWL